jgi:hypothetical protein
VCQETGKNEEEYRKRIASSYFRNIKTLVLEKTGPT